MKKIMVVTTIREGAPSNKIEKVRSQVFLHTARELQKYQIPCVALETESSESYLQMVRSLGVHTVTQTTKGMGNSRREALRTAQALANDCQHFLWLEPEKPDLPRFAKSLSNEMSKVGAVYGLFNRTTMDSYPPEQAHFYLFCRVVASNLLGFDIDYAFGPLMMSEAGLNKILEYDGKYGDLWDSIHIPKLRSIIAKAPFVQLAVDFKNDPSMTEVETNCTPIILKRLDQFNNIVPSLLAECKA